VGLALSFSALIGGFLWSSKNNRPGFTNCTVSTCTNQILKLSFESLLYKMKKILTMSFWWRACIYINSHEEQKTVP
jgi:hypothetical protein